MAADAQSARYAARAAANFCGRFARLMEGPPLSRWELEGFRSIRERVNIELGQMNILVGANSAGKSSLIQSILLAAQTLGSNWTPRPLLLNGPLVQLGLPDDCINEQTKGAFAFGFTYCSPDDPDLATGAPEQQGTVNVEAGFSVKRGGLDIARVKTMVTAPGDKPEETIKQWLLFERGTKQVMRDKLRTYGFKGARLETMLQTGAIPVDVSPALPSVVAARFRQFLPQTIYEHENLNASALAFLIRAVELEAERRTGEGRRIVTRPALRQRLRRQEVPRAVAGFVGRYLKSHGIKAPLPTKATLSVAELTGLLPPQGLEAMEGIEKSDWFAAHHDDLPADVALTRATADEPFDSLVQSARSFFVGSVRHLGPIRLEPKPLYGLSEAASGDSVGSSGEYTAALLNTYGSRLVTCPIFDENRTVRTTLSHAVDYWLAALGLLSSVAVEERGKLGYEISLRIAGVKKTLDLTAVGVGVSQALPVIVQGLVAPPRSLVMLEQPELHLHPDVQAAIADFCIALARSGRQVILETHSEYLVNRIRLRAVEDASEEIPDLVRLHFVERKDGATQVRPVRLTSQGGLRDWPAGFMDQSAREAERIIEAIERKSH